LVTCFIILHFPTFGKPKPRPKTISEKGTSGLLTICENVLSKSRTRHEQRASVYQIQIKLFIIIVMNTTSIAAGAALLLLPVYCCAVQMEHGA
jgi:hypothetical protein